MTGVPYTFGSATAPIPLSQLDSNFNTQLTIGSTTIGLGNTVTSLAGLVNVTMSNALSLGSFAAGGTASTVGGLSGVNSVKIASDSSWGLVIQSTAASTPFGVGIKYSALAPNGTTDEFIYCEDSSAQRFGVRSNGGIANFSANNINLSDGRTKPIFERFEEATLDQLESAFTAVDWGRYKYADQTHDDWNYGCTAQGAAAAFATVDPEIVDIWNPSDPPEKQMLGIYEGDLNYISHALLSRALMRISALETKIGASNQ